ncbi:MAG: T9SS type A sorting domain-containing protein [Flavobacteriales bacterium]|jgi:hypothetical protein
MEISTRISALRVFLLAIMFVPVSLMAQEISVAMKWNQVQLNGIRKDAARPTVQARNLYHASILLYDCWAVYDNDASTVFLGKTLGNYTCPFNGIIIPEDRQAAQEKAMSYAMYRFMAHRYSNAPLNNWNTFILGYCNDLMAELGYPTNITSTDYSDGDPAKLGNYIAARMQEYAFQDGSNQQFNYANQYYQTVNGDLFPEIPGNALQYDGNRWQPLSLTVTLDQNGFPLANSAPALSSEWGNVVPFALTEEDKTVYQRDSYNWNVYHDQGHPPYLDTITEVERQWDEDFFRWGFATVAIWHSFHDVADGVMKDISPNSIGNVDLSTLPTTFEEYKNFYNVFEGGTSSDQGYDINPATGLPYPEQIVPRADYSRVLSEYWADGPQSETPPGHWFLNINNINQHPLLEKRWGGEGDILEDLEWDVRSYLALGGAIHDAAVACWSTKGYYDFTRPIMAIRYMIDHGQCSDMSLPNYDPAGIPLIPGFIEVIEEGDPLAGTNNEHVGKIKLYTFRGPVEATGMDGVGWIRGENWWTFQVRTFVTPPFPGYYSGHSTYSRTAAEVLTRITGSEYYPGGLGEFVANPGYLRASTGPSVQTRLQWAKYADAADQCSLSRIYGGLHPPCDDIPGRRVGLLVGPAAFEKAESFMLAGIPHVASISADKTLITDADVNSTVTITVTFTEEMNTGFTPEIQWTTMNPTTSALALASQGWVDAQTYTLTYNILDANQALGNVVFKMNDAKDPDANSIVPALANVFIIDTSNPSIVTANISSTLINDATAQDGFITATFNFTEAVNQTTVPNITFADENIAAAVSHNTSLSFWQSATSYQAFFDVVDSNIEGFGNIAITGVADINGNPMVEYGNGNLFELDTQNPTSTINTSELGINFQTISDNFTVQAVYPEPMSALEVPSIAFSGNDISAVLGSVVSEGWTDTQTYQWTYAINQVAEEIEGINITISGGEDANGNAANSAEFNNAFEVDFNAPVITSTTEVNFTLTDANAVENTFGWTIDFNEPMNTEVLPSVVLSTEAQSSIEVNTLTSEWLSETSVVIYFDGIDEGVELSNAFVTLSGYEDANGNVTGETNDVGNIIIDTRNPIADFVSSTNNEFGSSNNLVISFDEPMNVNVAPLVVVEPIEAADLLTGITGEWLSATSYQVNFAWETSGTFNGVANVTINAAQDVLGNPMEESIINDAFEVTYVGVDELALGTARLYPNPLMEGQNAIVELSGDMKNINIQILDVDGKVVSNNQNINTSNQRIELPTARLAAGNYLVRLYNNKAETTLKLMILK